MTESIAILQASGNQSFLSESLRKIFCTYAIYPTLGFSDIFSSLLNYLGASTRCPTHCVLTCICATAEMEVKKAIGTVQISTTPKAGTLPQLLIFGAALSISSSALESARALPEKGIVDLKTEQKARECLELGWGGTPPHRGETRYKTSKHTSCFLL